MTGLLGFYRRERGAFEKVLFVLRPNHGRIVHLGKQRAERSGNGFRLIRLGSRDTVSPGKVMNLKQLPGYMVWASGSSEEEKGRRSRDKRERVLPSAVYSLDNCVFSRVCCVRFLWFGGVAMA